MKICANPWFTRADRLDSAASSLPRWELWALVAILLLAAALRLIDLSDVPPGLRYDELLNYRMAGRVLAGERPLYFTGPLDWGHEPLFHYSQAAAMALLGESGWSLRLPSALYGLVGVLTAWLAARRLFGARVAVLTASALAASFWSLFFSREGLRILTVTPFHGLMIYFLWRGLERPPGERGRTILDMLLGGVFLGIPFYVYPASRLVPLLPILLALYLALFHRRLLVQKWWGLLLAVAAAVLVAAPLLAVILGQPGSDHRSGQLTGAWEALAAGDPKPVLDLTVRALGLFVWRGEEDWLYNVYGRPVFDPLAGAVFILGVGFCLWRWKRARFALLLLWLIVGLAPAALAPPPASLSHAIAALPPAYILLALGLDGLWCTFARQRRWIAALLAAAVVVAHGALSFQAYFGTWKNELEVCKLHQCSIHAVARALDASDTDGPVAIGAPYVNYWHPWNAVGFDLALRREDLHVRWFNPAGGWVWPAGENATVYFPSDPLGPVSFAPELETLFLADAEPVPGSRRFDAFRMGEPQALEERLEAVADTPLSWPPDLAHQPAPVLPLVFDERFALLGAELETNVVRPREQVRLVTYWQVLAADPAPVVAFAHLSSDGPGTWGQQDWLDVWADGLQPGDRFAQVHLVPLKPEVPPGSYHLELGLYGPDTLVRLPITGGADRVRVGEAIHVSQ